jgi:hypothetical protein
METHSSSPLVAEHLPRNHPVVTRDYSLFTPAIAEMVDTVARWIDDQVDGATLFGPSRFGKSSAVDHWLQALLSQRCGGHVPMVVWSHTDSGGAASVGRFHAHLLHASRHPLAQAARSPLDRQHMLIERWAELASQGGGRFLVLVIDEAQGMTQREWLWLVELHSLLDKERIRLCVFSVASLQVFDEPVGMAMSGGAHVGALPRRAQRRRTALCPVRLRRGNRVAAPLRDLVHRRARAGSVGQGVQAGAPCRRPDAGDGPRTACQVRRPHRLADEDGGTGRPACPVARRRWRRSARRDVRGLVETHRGRVWSSGPHGHRDGVVAAPEAQRIACMTTVPSSRLTWHQGSVLPYASLWHTVQRAMLLNALRARELPVSEHATDQTSFPRYVNLLYNEAGGVPGGAPVEALSTQRLARALGESEAAFSWAHLGRLQMSVRALVSPSIRVCRPCLAAGYHCALYSLRLLQACPIHGCELEDRCNCGEPFGGELVVLNQMNPGYCRCGRMAFVTRQTCRRPTLRHDELAPISAVAAWLERLKGVVRPLPADRHRQQAHDGLFLESVHAWCSELGLGGAPGSHRVNDSVPLLASVSEASLATIERSGAVHLPATGVRAAAASRRRHSPYWSTDDATTIYRALARHVRRHVARGTEAHAIDFMLNPDPLQMGSRMRDQHRALVAFADLLFTECMEAHAGLRRWPYRDPRIGANRAIHGGLVQVPIDGGHAWPPASRDARLAWVRTQAACAAITHAWRRAQRLAMHAAATGFADWNAATEQYGPAGGSSSAYIDQLKPSGTALWFNAPPPFQVTWAAAVIGEHLRFVSVPATARIDWTLPRSSKAQRRTTWSTVQQQRATDLLVSCRGPCLTWSAHGGWGVCASARPEITPIKRHRLLGVAGAPRFWVFPRQGGFAARACEVRIQAFGATAREAVDALRAAVRQHRKQFPQEHPRPTKLTSNPLPLRPDSHPGYEAQVSLELQAHDFWKRAWMFGSLAREHLASARRSRR